MIEPGTQIIKSCPLSRTLEYTRETAFHCTYPFAFKAPPNVLTHYLVNINLAFEKRKQRLEKMGFCVNSKLCENLPNNVFGAAGKIVLSRPSMKTETSYKGMGG